MLSGGRIALHPVQLYEAAGLWLLAGIVGGGRRLPALRGRLFGLYLAGYGLLRLATETLRGDPARGLWLGGRLSTSQVIALLAIVAGALLAARRPAQKTPA
jgi:prolipoprotein diacylglyceryltransferase